jgi:hypothetical protein
LECLSAKKWDASNTQSDLDEFSVWKHNIANDRMITNINQS